MASLNNIASRLIESMSAPQDDAGTTRVATVARIDSEGTIWVRIAGASDETPIEHSSATVRSGDTVSVTIRDGRATINGNTSNPSAQIDYADSINNTAVDAHSSATQALSDAAAASAAASIAQTSANQASAAASTAQTSANQAAAAAASAQADATQAISDAADAADAAASAQADATAAGTAAQTAKSAADSAQADATQAISDATAATSAAATAGRAASVAQAAAEAAQTAANTAQTTANQASTAASTAQSTANAAQTKANQASTAASTAQTTANQASTAASTAQSTANAAQGDIDALREWFWHDANGAHVLGDESGYRNDIDSSGMNIVEMSTEEPVASFGADGAQIGKEAEPHIAVESTGMKGYNNGGDVVFDIVMEGALPPDYQEFVFGSDTYVSPIDASFTRIGYKEWQQNPYYEPDKIIPPGFKIIPSNDLFVDLSLSTGSLSDRTRLKPINVTGMQNIRWDGTHFYPEFALTVPDIEGESGSASVSSESAATLVFENHASIEINLKYEYSWTKYTPEIIMAGLSCGIKFAQGQSDITQSLGYMYGNARAGYSEDYIPCYTFGKRTGSKGDYSGVFGQGNTASGENSFATGDSNTVGGYNSLASGSQNEVNGVNASALGRRNVATGPSSTAAGHDLIAVGDGQLACGKFNEADMDSVFTVGNGESSSKRRNVFAVEEDGIVIGGSFDGDKYAKDRIHVNSGGTLNFEVRDVDDNPLFRWYMSELGSLARQQYNNGAWQTAQYYALEPANPIGTILEFAGSSAPSGYMICNGSAISRSTYAALFAVIGTTYGAGDGSTTFNIPDFRGRASIGVGNGTATGHTNHALASGGGEETVTLTAAQSGVPAHAHGSGTLQGVVSGAYQNNQSGDQHRYVYLNDSGGSRISLTGSTANNTAKNATSSHENMMPYLTVNKIIRVE